jgi:hypothetical protein
MRSEAIGIGLIGRRGDVFENDLVVVDFENDLDQTNRGFAGFNPVRETPDARNIVIFPGIPDSRDLAKRYQRFDFCYYKCIIDINIINIDHRIRRRSSILGGKGVRLVGNEIGSDFSAETAYRLGNRGDEPGAATVLDDMSSEFAVEVELSARGRKFAGRVRNRRFEEIGRH